MYIIGSNEPFLEGPTSWTLLNKQKITPLYNIKENLHQTPLIRIFLRNHDYT